MDVRIKSLQESVATFGYLARLDLAELSKKLGDDRLLESDVAKIYGVETKRINVAVKNNPDKFPQDYMIGLSAAEFSDLRSIISTAKSAKTRVVPNVFTDDVDHCLKYDECPNSGRASCMSDIAIRVSNLSKCYHIYDNPRGRSIHAFSK